MKFETEIDFTNRNQFEAQIRLYDNIQDGGDRHLGNIKELQLLNRSTDLHHI